jgi:putative ABC transport system ATP-binding protein
LCRKWNRAQGRKEQGGSEKTYTCVAHSIVARGSRQVYSPAQPDAGNCSSGRQAQVELRKFDALYGLLRLARAVNPGQARTELLDAEASSCFNQGKVSRTGSMQILEISHLTRTAGGKPIVEDVSLDIAEGELLAVVGPSGAGKSSLLRLLNRLDEPTSGSVLLSGQDYRELAVTELRRRVGMVMQRAFLFPGSVADNLRFGPRQRGIQLTDKQVDDLLGSVLLQGFAGRDALTLSGGEAQRVSLARALANEPEVLLLDEPTSALDLVSKLEVEAVLRRLWQGGLTMVWVSHDPEQVRRMASRVAVLRAGRLAKLGDPREVLDAEISLS